jgi:deoxyhypusine synthase
VATRKTRLSKHPRIDPRPIDKRISVTELVDRTFLAYNAARLREACQLFTRRMLADDVTVGVSLTGALTPAGLGIAALIPLMQHGFIDWMTSTGANLYHDTHFGIGLSMHTGTPFADDVALREKGIVRIYDIFFDYEVLLETDAFFRTVIAAPEFQRPMSTAEFHYRVGKYVHERERLLGQSHRSVLSTAYQLGVPIYTSSPGDSSIGMNVAAMALQGNQLAFDVSRDVNETAAIVLGAKQARATGTSATGTGATVTGATGTGATGTGGKSAILIIGGGSPKNFMLQTEPQIQEVLGIDERGHDYFLQITDARPDTGGLSGATPAEAVSWGKIDPDMLPSTVVCYLDATVALPILTAYAIANHKRRTPKRLYARREELLATLTRRYQQTLKKRRK